MATPGSCTMACHICHKESHYKCPVCRERYCSVACCKAHKLVCNGKSTSEVTISGRSDRSIPSELQTEDASKMEQLRYSPTMKSLLANRHLRDLLVELNAATLKPEQKHRLLDRLMNTPIFVEFADECLKVIDS